MAIIQLYALTSFILINKEEKAKSKMSTQKYICKVSTIFSDCILKGLVTKRPMFELMCQGKRPLCKTLNHFFPSRCQAFLVCISNMQIGPFCILVGRQPACFRLVSDVETSQGQQVLE